MRRDPHAYQRMIDEADLLRKERKENGWTSIDTSSDCPVTNHTPGPWYVGIKQPSPIIYGANGASQVANLTNPLVFDGENEANAHLIAAAPELLEALQELLNSLKEFLDPERYEALEQHWPGIKSGSLAINKALNLEQEVQD